MPWQLAIEADAAVFRRRGDNRKRPHIDFWSGLLKKANGEPKPMSYVRRRKRSISEAIDATVGCLPPELTGITADYLIDHPHTWTDFKAGPIPNGTTNTIRVVPTDDDDRIVRLVAAYSWKVSWRTMVSARSLASAHLEWTIDFTFGNVIGVGVTLLPSNRYVDNGSVYVNMAFDTDWIIYPDYYPTVPNLVYVHNRKQRELKQKLIPVPRFGPPSEIRFRFVFIADPIDRTVTAQLFQAFGDEEFKKQDAPVVLATVESPAVFAALRPCMVVGGGSCVIGVRSGRMDDYDG